MAPTALGGSSQPKLAGNCPNFVSSGSHRGATEEPPREPLRWRQLREPPSGSHDARRMKPCCSAGVSDTNTLHKLPPNPSHYRPPASWGASRGPLNPPRCPQHPQGSHRAAPKMPKGFAVLVVCPHAAEFVATNIPTTDRNARFSRYQGATMWLPRPPTA